MFESLPASPIPQSPAIAAITKAYGPNFERAKDNDLKLLIRQIQIHLTFEDQPMHFEVFDGYLKKTAKLRFTNDPEGLRYLSKICLELANRLEF
jgi:hypothetical protein